MGKALGARQDRHLVGVHGSWVLGKAARNGSRHGNALCSDFDEHLEIILLMFT
jgi:hypothetical protein